MNHEELLAILQKYKENRLSAEEHRQLESWMNESESNRLLAENFIKLYKLNNQCQAIHKINTEQAWKNYCQKRKNRQLRKLVIRFSAAACLLILIGTGLYFLPQAFQKIEQHQPVAALPNTPGRITLTLDTGETIEMNDSTLNMNEHLLTETESSASDKTPAQETRLNVINVPLGEKFSLTLADGTKVWLNSDTQLRFPSTFTDKRFVELRGEAFFDVAKNGNPFNVVADGVKVHVLGTRFNVSVRHDSPSQITLVQGGVEVSNGKQNVILKPGQQAELTAEAPITVRQVNTECYTVWISGIFNFDNLPLTEITALLERWHGICIDIAEPSLRSLRLSGTLLQEHTPEYTFELLKKASGIRFEKQSRNKYILRH